MIRRIAAIAHNALREALRDRVLYNLVLFVLLLTASAIFLGELSGGQERKIIVDFGLSAILLFGTFIAIFVGVGLVFKEIERRTVYALFSKPVYRSEFLIGKFLGLCLTLLVNVAIMGIGVSLALTYVSGGWNLWRSRLACNIFYLCRVDDCGRSRTLILLVFIALSISVTHLLCFYHRPLQQRSEALASSTKTLGARMLFSALYYVLPNLSNYSLITPASHGQLPQVSQTLIALVYGLVYISVVLSASTLIFRRRNFK